MAGSIAGACRPSLFAATCVAPSLLLWGCGPTGVEDLEANGDNSSLDRAGNDDRALEGPGRWVLAAPEASCAEACKKNGGTCDVNVLRSTDSQAKVLGAAAQAGKRCGSRDGATAEWKYKHNPSICTGASCCGGGSCQGICTFGSAGGDCDTRAPKDASRLCPCAEEGVEQVNAGTFHWGSGINGLQSTAGFSWYTRAWTLNQEAGAIEWQMGAAGNWMKPVGVDFGDTCACDPNGWPSASQGDQAFGCCQKDGDRCGWLFQSVEGGPGYWSGNMLPSRTMKWRIVVTTACYSNGGQTPLFFYGDNVRPCDQMGVIQVSNRMLLSPDGISFSREGLIGVGFVGTPIGKTSDSDGRNFWTFVVDASNFAGPIAYLLPELFAERVPALKDLEVQRRLTDLGSPGMKMSNGGGFAFEWNTMFTLKQGDIYKIPKMAVPMTNGKSTIAMGGRGYDKADVYAPLEEVLAGRRQLSQVTVMSKSTLMDCSNSERDAQYYVTKDKAKAAVMGKFKTEKTATGCVWSMIPSDSSGRWPQYFRHSDMRPLAESEVPLGLRQKSFPAKGTIWKFMGPYDARAKKPAGGCLDSPGPADPKMYCAFYSSGPGWLGYKWYKFVDQPGLQRLRLTAAQKTFMQQRVERLHRQLSGKDRWIKDGPSELAEVSGAQVVVPPSGMQYGYVPIAVYEGVEKPSGCA